MRALDGHESNGSYRINPFEFLILGNDHDPMYQFRIERDSSGRVIRLIDLCGGLIFNRITRRDEL